MKRPITISLSPNTEPDDVERARYVLAHPEMWEDPQYILEAKQKLADIFPGHAVALTSSGRQALYRILKALGVGEGDEVIIQAFTCIAVPAAILWVGAKPVYADIVSDTYNLDPEDVRKKITSATKAIIIQHTFGIPGPTHELQSLAREHTIALIEDCAHALGQTHQGKMLGTFGDAAILSFGRDKIISCVFGGAVVSKNHELIERIRKEQHALPTPPRAWVRQQLRHPLAMNVIIPTYFQAALGKLLLVLLQRLGFLSKAVAPEERKGGKPEHFAYRTSPALAYLLLNQLEKLERFTARRKEIVKKYSAAFASRENALLRFPLQRQNPHEIILAARRQGMLLGDWYDAPLGPYDSSFSVFQYTSGSCPVAEEVSKRIINLPTYPLLTDEQVEEVISFIKSYDQRNH